MLLEAECVSGQAKKAPRAKLAGSVCFLGNRGAQAQAYRFGGHLELFEPRRLGASAFSCSDPSVEVFARENVRPLRFNIGFELTIPRFRFAHAERFAIVYDGPVFEEAPEQWWCGVFLPVLEGGVPALLHLPNSSV